MTCVETTQVLTDTQSCGREGTADLTPHKLSRTCRTNNGDKWTYAPRHSDASYVTGCTDVNTYSMVLPFNTHTAELTQHGAQKRRRHVCASWGLLLPCTPWQNTHVLASGNMQTGWPGRGGGSRWRSQRSASHTSDWRQTDRRGRRGAYETVITVRDAIMRRMSWDFGSGHWVLCRKNTVTFPLHPSQRCLPSSGLWWRTGCLSFCTLTAIPAEIYIWINVHYWVHLAILTPLPHLWHFIQAYLLLLKT